MTSLKGHLLVASPHLGDANFVHTVVLMVQHDAGGALRLVLNRPSGRTIRDIWEQLTGRPSENEAPIFIGGPLEGPLMAVHTLKDCAESEILPGLWFATHRDHLHQIVDDGQHPFRLFSGYAGWGEGQLDGELKAGGWLTVPASPKHVFAEDDEYLWQQITREIGHEILKSAHIKHVPDDPSMN